MRLFPKTFRRLSALIWAFGLPISPAVALEFEYAGLVELDWNRTSLRDAGQRTLTTDASVSTLELALAAFVTPQWHADLTLLSEDIGVTHSADYIPAPGATDKRPDRLHVDEFTLGYSSERFEAAAGRMTLPFGRYETALLTDPQTLALGETATEAGARAIYHHDVAYVGGAIFNGNRRSVAPDEAGYVAFVGLDVEHLQLQLAYLSAQYAGEDAPALADLVATIQGQSWFASSEYVGAWETQQGQRPRAWHVEAGYVITPGWDAALRYQRTWEFPVLDGGDGRYREWAIGANHALTEHIAIGLEHAVATEGGPHRHSTLLRLAFEF